MTVRVKKFDLDTVYFGKKEDSEKNESIKNQLCRKDRVVIKKGNRAILQN